MYVDQQIAERPKGLDRRRRIVYPHTASATRRNHAPNQKHAILARRQSLPIKKRVHVSGVKLRFYAGIPATVADRARVCTCAKRKRERPHENALSRTGLAGDDGKTVAKLRLGMFHHGKIVNFQPSEHITDPPANECIEPCRCPLSQQPSPYA